MKTNKITLADGFNSPYLPQNSWTNQCITPGIVDDDVTSTEKDLIEVEYEISPGVTRKYNVPDFNYTEAGFFRRSDDPDRTTVSFNGTAEDWLVNEKLNLKFPFKKEGNYYVFDSDSMYTDNVLDKDPGDKIRLFETDEDTGPAPMVANKRGFWPFATSEEMSAYETTDATSHLSDQYHFGMNLNAKFVAPAGLTVTGEDGTEEDMVFEFSGDDDLWIFIDGELALDVGGCHAAMDGTINFTDGVITYSCVLDDLTESEDWNNDSGNKLYFENSATSQHASPTLDRTANVKWSFYSEAESDGETYDKYLNWSTDKFAEGTLHDVEIFYLERGTGESNCRMQFNISTVSPIETEKTAYVNEADGTTRDLNTEDSFAYTGQDVYFELEVENCSGQNLEDLVVYDKELKVLFDGNGIKKNVNITEDNADDMYLELHSYSEDDYDYTWSDDGDIAELFETFEKDETLTISENGVTVNQTSYGTTYDIDEIKSVLKRKTTKDVRDDETEENSMYAIGRCDEVAFGTPYVGNFDDIQYKVEDTRLYIRQIVEDGTTKELLSDAKPALVDTVSEDDTRSLYFPSNEPYTMYTSYYNHVDYEVLPTIPADYELVAIDVDDTRMADGELFDSSEYNGNTTFNYTGQQYEKYVTIYLRKTENTDWHNSKAIVNEFNPIVVD